MAGVSRPPSHARAIIVGLSTAYHLAREGYSEIVVLEANKLTSGSTWHAVGRCATARTSPASWATASTSNKRLEAETGQATVAHSFGLEMEILTPTEVLDLWPAMQVDDIVGAAWLPGDGRPNPSDTAMALAAGARHGGVVIVEDCPVIGTGFATHDADWIARHLPPRAMRVSSM